MEFNKNKKEIAVFIESDLDDMVRNSFVFVLRIKSNLDYSGSMSLF